MNNISIKTGNLYDKGFRRTIYRKEIADMFKIIRFPSKLKSFFNSLENQFHWHHFEREPLRDINVVLFAD
jgi:hypothetical protein